MAGLREAVKDYQDELQAGIAWVAFWREGRSWHSDYIYLETDDTLTPEDRGRLREIQEKDPAAVVLNGYYCGYLGEDMNLAELTAGVRRHYENGYNNVADFIEAHDDTLPPELLEEARAAAHVAGLPFSEKPYRDGEDFNPYVFDGSMSINDFELMHRMMNEERSKQMSETFSILIDSRTRFETGKPGGEWLSMPTTTEQLHAAMRSVGITADNPQDFFINGFSNTEQYPFDVPLSVIQGSTIDELNYLGKLLKMQSDEDRDKFTAAVMLGEHAGSVKDLINLAQNLDCYWIYPTVRSEADYGYYLIDELDELELPEEAKKYFKYEEYGRDAVQKDRGQFTDQGYIYNNGNTFSQWYKGRDNDIPKEYKVMSFPEPERPTPDKLEKDEAAPEQEAAPQEPQPEAQPRPVNPIILTADKPAEKLKEITDRLEQGITELFDSERYKEYLQVMSKFHNYSFNNTLLIAMQKPDASLIAGFSAWKNNFGRNVMRGEKGIRILAPSPYKIRQEVEKKDPQTGKTVIGSDGKPVTETKEIQIPAYKVVAVFDVSQTEGRELPSISANELTGDVEQYEDFFAALEKTSPVPMGFEKIEGTAHGYYHLEEKRIAIDEGMSQLQNLKTAIHEIAHAKLHDIDLNAPEQPDRPDPQLGKFERFEVQPKDPEALQFLLREEKESRDKLKPGDFKEHIAALHEGMIDREARRIVADMKKLSAPNSPDKSHFMVELSPSFMRLASTKDTERLFSMLPYKTLAFSQIKNSYGTYALIGKDENRDRQIRKPRPSVRAQLAQDKKRTAPKKTAAKTKNHGLEV